QRVYRASIYLAETDQKADEWFESLHGPQSRRRLGMTSAVEQAVQAARTGSEFDLRNVISGSAQGDVTGAAPRLNFMGGPDTIVKQIKAFHDQCGTGVVDLFFQQPRVDHSNVMRQIELFGKEVLPQIKEF
ncbi:MAG: hypothetical protein IID52_08740, partial [Proteobacteria bacterium]|nr:hypothetical protein [Pseudomonadota bacterium]